MSIKRFKMRKSLILTCAWYLLIYSLILFLVYNTVSYFIYNRLNTAFPSMDNLLEYEDELSAETFSEIPLSHSSQCGFIVFDGDGRTVYATSRELSENINAGDTELIPDYYGAVFYSVFKKINTAGQVYYYVYLNMMDEDTDTAQMVGSCMLDETYRIVSGDNLFGKDQLTKKEFGLLQGQYDENQDIEKYDYQTDEGEDRTVVLVSLQMNMENYDKMVNNANRLWIVAVPTVILIAAIEIVLIIRKIRQSIQPLNAAIESYRGRDHFQVEKESIPMEFQPTVDRFSELVSRLSAMQAEKEETYQENQRIIADISHDLKTPLTVIQGYSKALMEGRVPEEKREKYLETICSRAELAAGLLDSLFEYVKMDHPGYEPDRKEMDLGEFIREILAEKYSEMENQGFHMEVDIQERPVLFMADAKLFRRLLENLLGNGVKYNPPGTTIYVSLEEKGKQIVLTVADDGVGIPDSIGRQVFDPFITGSAARTSGEGTGLGLSIVKKIVELHGGTICLVQPPHKPFHTEFQMKWGRKG